MSSFGFVHISQTKPRLAAAIGHEFVFKWNGTTPKLDKKEDVFNGDHKDVDDKTMMNLLLQDAFKTWNEVEGSYLKLAIEEDANASIDTKVLVSNFFTDLISKGPSLAIG